MNGWQGIIKQHGSGRLILVDVLLVVDHVEWWNVYLICNTLNVKIEYSII